MKHRSIVLAAATVVSIGGALLGCGSGDDIKAGASTTSASGATQTATDGSSGVSTASAGTAAQRPNTAGRSSAPSSTSSGSQSVPTTGSATAAASGTSGSPPATGAPSATGGPSTATGGAPAGSAGAAAASGGMPAGSASTPAGTGSPVGASGSCGPAITIPAAMLGDQAMATNGITTFKNFGPWKPMHVEGTGPTGASWIFFPEGFGKDGMKHPVFVWGPGAGTGPSNYQGYLDLLASHGIVTICQPSTNSGKQALDWILKENDSMGSMWFGKLDPDRVARGGHSMGALQSLSESKDDRLKATVLVCGGANGSGGADGITYPSIFLGATGEGGTDNFKADYAQVKGPSLFVTAKMSDHIACGRDNMAPWVAFLRWRLCGEETLWKKEFMAGGTFCTGKWEACMEKNF